MIFFLFSDFFCQLYHSHLTICIGELIISCIISTTVREMLFSLLVCHREPFTYRETKFWIIQPAWKMAANFYLRSFQVGKDEDLFSSPQEAKHINVDWRNLTFLDEKKIWQNSWDQLWRQRKVSKPRVDPFWLYHGLKSLWLYPTQTRISYCISCQQIPLQFTRWSL